MPEFHVDQRVTSLRYGNGTVVSIAALDRGIIGVRRDGRAQSEGWHPSVWVPMVEVTFSVKRTPQKLIVIPAAEFHKSCTDSLGAQHGEYEMEWEPRESAAWSAHLRFLVNQSASRDTERAHSVGWDPYGDD